jgi:hypothetical protein
VRWCPEPEAVEAHQILGKELLEEVSLEDLGCFLLLECWEQQ